MRKRMISIAAAAAIVGGGLLGFAPAAHASDEVWCDGVTVVGSPHADRIVGTDCDDVLYGLGGADHIRGLFGTDDLIGGRGNDLISDPSQYGTIHGNRGWDTCIVRADSQINVFGCEDIIET